MKHDSPLFSVIIPWKNRPVIAETLRHNEGILTGDRCEILVVECGSEPGVFQALEDFPGHVRCIAAPCETFNKGYALNVGAAASRGSFLFFLDADVVLDEDVLGIAADRLRGDCFVTVARVRESDRPGNAQPVGQIELAYFTEIALPCGKRILLETNRVRPHEGTRSGPGLIALHRRHFLAVAGMNSALEGWGWEDLDLIARLQFELALPRFQAGLVTHLSHPDEERLLRGQTRAQSEQANYLVCLANYCAGLFMGTFESDLRRWRETAPRQTRS